MSVSKSAKSVPPKTGDDTMFWLYGIIFTAAMGSMLVLVVKEYARKRKQAREDAEMFAQRHDRHNYVHNTVCINDMILLLSV